MNRSWAIAIAIGVMTVLGGCGQKDGEHFLGKWGSQTRKGMVEITRNGDSFLIADTHPDFMTGAMTTDKVPATYHDGVLQVSTAMGSGDVGYDKARDTLLMPTMGGSAELTRIK